VDFGLHYDGYEALRTVNITIVTQLTALHHPLFVFDLVSYRYLSIQQAPTATIVASELNIGQT
jgi:hypothetical protein